MHDTLDYTARDPIYRSYHHHQMTFSMMYAYSENYVLPISHDEVVHGKGSLVRKMPGDRWQQLANLRALLAHMWAHPGKQLLFMGCEFGQESEWSEERSLDWWLLDNPDHRGVQSLVRDLNRVYRETPALWARDVDPAGFAWIDANDAEGNVFSFFRCGPAAQRLRVGARCWPASPTTPARRRRATASGCPGRAAGPRCINTDAEGYAGSGVGNFGAVHGRGPRAPRAAGVGGAADPAARGALAALRGLTPGRRRPRSSAAESTAGSVGDRQQHEVALDARNAG